MSTQRLSWQRIARSLFPVMGVLIFLPLGRTGSTVRFANNNPGAAHGPLVYSSLQTAIDSSKPGDTVYVVPSSLDYGGTSGTPVLVYRKLVILGIGFAPPQRDQRLLSRCSYLSLYVPGPGNSDRDPSGSVISGLAIQTLNLHTSNSAGALHDVVIEKDSISFQLGDGSTAQPIRNITIRYNKIGVQYAAPGITFPSATLTTSLVYNNIIGRVVLGSTSSVKNIFSNNIFITTGYYAYLVDILGANIFSNNIFTGLPSVFYRMVACLFCNNIIYGPGTSLYSGSGGPFEQNTFANNIISASLAPGDTLMPPTGTGPGNVGSGNRNAVPQFKSGTPNLTTLTVGLNDFQLAGTPATNPAFNGGTDNTDIGLSGGPYPWNSTWYATSLPVIQSLSLNNIIRVGDSLKVTIKAVGQ